LAESAICQPPPEHAVLLWPQVEPLLRPALATTEGCYEPVDILAAILKGQMQLWISWNDGVEAAMVTEIIAYPRRRGCRVFLIGGRNLKRWSEKFSAAVEAYARAQGCSFMEGGARLGWVRVGGYRNIGCVLIKEL
jgi:hypothetical protein